MNSVEESNDIGAAVYRFLLEQLDTGVLIADEQRRILEAKAAAARLLSVRGGSTVGKTLLDAALC